MDFRLSIQSSMNCLGAVLSMTCLAHCYSKTTTQSYFQAFPGQGALSKNCALSKPLSRTSVEGLPAGRETLHPPVSCPHHLLQLHWDSAPHLAIKTGQPHCAEKAARGWDSGDLNLRMGPTTTSVLGHVASSLESEDWG